MSARIIYRSADGQTLTDQNLMEMRRRKGGGHPIPDEAKALHQRGREAGARGDYAEALALFAQAEALAPDWAYPAYDTAFTYMLLEDTAKAEACYERVDRMEPNGFFMNKTFLDSLRRERRGELPPNFTKGFSMLEDYPDKAEKLSILQAIVAKFPNYPPAWKELSALLDDDDERLAAFDHGLAGDPDPDTRGVLLVNKALLLASRGRRDEATRMLAELALAPDSTVGNEAFARMALKQITAS